MRLPKRSQSLNADSPVGAAPKRVPRASPARIGERTSARVPDAITAGTPAAAASSAAAILLSIPPLPVALERPIAAPRAAAPSEMSVARSSPGACVRTPSTLVSRTSSRARRSTATWAASASLSPNAISSVAVASFSFTTGTAPSANSAPSVSRRFE